MQGVGESFWTVCSNGMVHIAPARRDYDVDLSVNPQQETCLLLRALYIAAEYNAPGVVHCRLRFFFALNVLSVRLMYSVYSRIVGRVDSFVC